MDLNLPFHFIRSSALQVLLDTVARRNILMPSTRYFMKTLDDRFNLMKIQLVNLLSMQKYLCLTCDVWSSRAVSFIGITVHFIDEQYSRRSYVLSFRELKVSQNYECLASEMSKIIHEYNVHISKVTNIVTDGGSAFCKAFRVFGGREDKHITDPIEELPIENIDDDRPTDGSITDFENLPFMAADDGEIFLSNIITLNGDENIHELNENESSTGEDEDNSNFFEDIDCIDSRDRNEGEDAPEVDIIPLDELPAQRRCLSHLLNLISKDFQKALPKNARAALISAISKLHSLWVCTHRSSEAKRISDEVIGCRFPLPNETRWNALYDAIEKSSQKDIKPKINFLIQRLVSEAKKNHLQTLTNNDWCVLTEYLKVMRPVAGSLDRLQAEQNGSQGFILPTLISMKHHISKVDGNAIAVQFRKTMLEVLSNRFDRHIEVSERNKDLVLAAVSLPRFKNYFLESETNQKRMCLMLKEECYRMSEEDSSQVDNDGHRNDDQCNIEEDFYVSFARTVDQRRCSIENDIETEIARYFNDTRKQESSLDDYKYIKMVYYKYNTTLSASAAIERVFSQSLMIFRPRRNRIHADNFERQLLLKFNRKLIDKVDRSEKLKIC